MTIGQFQGVYDNSSRKPYPRGSMSPTLLP